MNTESIPLINGVAIFEDKEFPWQPGKEVVERNVAHAIVRNPETKEILCLKSKKSSWRSLIVGGIDDGEDAVDAAIREIWEETGYKNVRFVATLGKTQTKFFADVHDENRIANATGLLFEVVDLEQDPISPEEAEKHSCHWVPESEVDEFLHLANQNYIWKKAQEVLEVSE